MKPLNFVDTLVSRAVLLPVAEAKASPIEELQQQNTLKGQREHKQRQLQIINHDIKALEALRADKVKTLAEVIKVVEGGQATDQQIDWFRRQEQKKIKKCEQDEARLNLNIRIAQERLNETAKRLKHDLTEDFVAQLDDQMRNRIYEQQDLLKNKQTELSIVKLQTDYHKTVVKDYFSQPEHLQNQAKVASAKQAAHNYFKRTQRVPVHQKVDATTETLEGYFRAAEKAAESTQRLQAYHQKYIEDLQDFDQKLESLKEEEQKLHREINPQKDEL